MASHSNRNPDERESITVSTKTDLELAKSRGYAEIVVLGNIADNLKRTKKITYTSVAALAIISAALIPLAVVVSPAANPVTVGLISRFAAAPVATLTGLDISTIIIASSLGLTLIIAVFKDYEEISYEKGKLVLRKRK